MFCWNAVLEDIYYEEIGCGVWVKVATHTCCGLDLHWSEREPCVVAGFVAPLSWTWLMAQRRPHERPGTPSSHGCFVIDPYHMCNAHCTPMIRYFDATRRNKTKKNLLLRLCVMATCCSQLLSCQSDATCLSSKAWQIVNLAWTSKHSLLMGTSWHASISSTPSGSSYWPWGLILSRSILHAIPMFRQHLHWNLSHYSDALWGLYGSSKPKSDSKRFPRDSMAESCHTLVSLRQSNSPQIAIIDCSKSSCAFALSGWVSL